MVSIKQKAERLRKKLSDLRITNKNSPQSITVNIDLNQFKDGYDPLVNVIDYGYNKMAKITVPVGDRLSKIGNFKIAKKVFNKWLTTRLGDKGRSGKQKPFIFNKLDKLDVCKHEFGECLIGAANKTSSGFKVRFMNKTGSDSYVHHVAILANSNNVDCIHNMRIIETISSKKTGTDQRSISHLCGNGGCARPGHLRIENKTVNDERTHCHFLLRRSLSQHQSEMIGLACPHTPKCFVNIYKTNKPYY